MTNDFEPMLGWINDQTPTMVDRIMEWSLLCTGSEYPPGLDAMCSKLEAAFHTLSPSAPELVPLRLDSLPPETRTALRIHCRREAPTRVLLAGHYDTVYDSQHLFQDVTRDGDNR